MSAGLRYEVQSNLGGFADWAPRMGVAWGLDGKPNRPARSLIRAGFGFFYDRIPLTTTLNARRYDGTTQQSFLILKSVLLPRHPAAWRVAKRRGAPRSNCVRSSPGSRVAGRLVSDECGYRPATQEGKSRLSVNWIQSRGVHLMNARNINAPVQAELLEWRSRASRAHRSGRD